MALIMTKKKKLLYNVQAVIMIHHSEPVQTAYKHRVNKKRTISAFRGFLKLKEPLTS
jgi:hypothetical protein